eukprot:9574732-Alexandrium_andersonii.AAC.1
MSASLVGSEMCIRDRAGVQEAVRSLAEQVEPCCYAVAVMLSAPTELWFCLLYTSDAADDM